MTEECALFVGGPFDGEWHPVTTPSRWLDIPVLGYYRMPDLTPGARAARYELATGRTTDGSWVYHFHGSG